MFATIVEGRAAHAGTIAVARVLPWRGLRAVGPFVFLDHMGPTTFAPGDGADVGPHPHIGLATVTYLFAGEVVHRDSVGAVQPIRPGDVNWMNAGRGVVHSERTDPRVRAAGVTLHGLQAWVALPLAEEESAPTFAHHPAATLPSLDGPGVRARLIAGTARGARSPVEVRSPLFYLEAHLAPRAALPLPDEHAERAAYVVDGALEGLARGQLGLLTPEARAVVAGAGGAHVMLLGGAPLEAPRHMWWNFVSSDPARIERAAAEWAARRFPAVADDDGPPVPAPARR